MKKTVYGIKVDEITYKEPRNGLPQWVKAAAAVRGYGDALQPVTLFVTESDVEEAFSCAAQGNGSACVMAQAGRRLGAEAVYFYRNTAWIDFGAGPIIRFRTGKSIFNNVIDPFDRGDQEQVIPGLYPLMPPTNSMSLKRRREYERTDRKHAHSNGAKTVHAHTERVVMATHAAAS